MSSATSLEEIGICWLRFDLFWSYWTGHQKINVGRITNPEPKIFDETFYEIIGQTFDFFKIFKVTRRKAGLRPAFCSLLSLPRQGWVQGVMKSGTRWDKV